jgi:hypothetical protein
MFKIVQKLRFWTLSIVLSSSKNTILFIFQNTALSPEIGTSSIDWAQLSRFYLKTETESSLRNVVFCKINRTVFLDKTRCRIISRNIIFVLTFHRHKPLDLMFKID